MQIEKPLLSFKGKLTPIKKVNKLVCHHPAHKTWGIMDIHNYHRNTNGWAGIGYNYLILKDGRIQEGRGKNVGAHCKNYNSTTLGICFQGNFDQEHMTDAQVRSGGWLVAKLIREHGLQINDVIGHRDLANTACPGKNFRMNDLKNEALVHLNPNVKKEEVKVADKKPSEWAKKSWEKTQKKKGKDGKSILDGTRPKEPITREEYAVTLDRLGLLD